LSTPSIRGHADLGDQAQLYFEVCGRGEPLVLIHGGNLDPRMWSGQVCAFAAGYRVVAYDVRGFGQSSPKDRPHQAHRDLLVLLDHLKISAKAHPIGLSLGGRIAVDFALTNADRVRSLILAALGLNGWDWKRSDREPIMVAMQALTDQAYARSAVAETWLACPYMAPAMEHPGLRPLLRAWTMDNIKELLRAGPDPEVPLSPPAVGRTADITAPTLLLLGSRDVAYSKEIAKLLRQTVPVARLIEFEGVGHMINLEAPYRFNRECLTFLRSVAALGGR
jgi:pimeloyl-ACP methyl ester carboxylesterase